MGSRFPSHQLSNGLFVSGRPEQPKERAPPMSSTAVPYTGGDIKKSGELGKMFDIPVVDPSKARKFGPTAPARGGAGSHSGPIACRSGYSSVGAVSFSGATPSKKSNSGPLNKHGEPMKKSSGPQSPLSRQNSGPLLQATGLITSGPLSTSRKGAGEAAGPTKGPGGGFCVQHNQAVTTIARDEGEGGGPFSKVSKGMVWAVVLLFVMGLVAGGFILGAVHNVVLLLAVGATLVVAAALAAWNRCSGRKGVVGFIARCPDAELRTAKNGQYVKISGVVTCGNVPLESSFRRVPRCVYTATGLYEYRGWGSKPANSSHRLFTWGLRSLESRVADFYISDFQSGLRALVKTGYGARVTPHVDDCFVMEVTPENRDQSPEFIHWLGDRHLSLDDRTVRLKEGYVKEGSTVSVMGVVQRNENILMIVPPGEAYSTGCQWTRCLFPYGLDGIVLRCEDTSKTDAIPV